MDDLTVTCPSVTLGSSSLENPGGTSPNPTVVYVTDDGEGNEAWKLEYTIPDLNTAGANGIFGFDVTLVDEAGNQNPTTNMTPPNDTNTQPPTTITVTVDTVAPALESGGNPSLDLSLTHI